MRDSLERVEATQRPERREAPWTMIFRQSKRLIVLLSVVVLAAELALLCALGVSELITLIPDDSFFYLIIARNALESGEFTFDGIHPTYGFQPLWQLCLIPVSAVCGSSSSQLYATLVLCSLLHVATGLAIYRLVGSLCGRLAAASSAVFWLLNPSILRWFWGMKENGLYLLLLVLLMLRYLGWLRGRAGVRGAVVLGLLGGLAMLARVNFAMLGVALCLVMLAAPAGATALGARRTRLRFVLSSLGVAISVCVPWFLYARFQFDSLMPTSGAVKLQQGRLHASEVLGVEWMSAAHFALALKSLPAYLDSTIKIGSGVYGPILLGLFLWLASYGVSRLGTVDRRVWREAWAAQDGATLHVLGVLILLALLNSAANVLALPTYLAYGQWYTVPEYLALAVGCGILVAVVVPMVRGSSARLTALTLVIVSSCVGWSLVRARGWNPHFSDPRRGGSNRHPNQALLEVGLWAREHVPEGARVGIWDPGIVTFFSERSMTSLDPLVNSREYFERLQGDQLAYAHEEGFSYVFGPGTWKGEYRFLHLPSGSYHVIWVPRPDFDLGWTEDEPNFYMLVRPLGATGPAFLQESDFDFGAYLPNGR